MPNDHLIQWLIAHGKKQLFFFSSCILFSCFSSTPSIGTGRFYLWVLFLYFWFCPLHVSLTPFESTEIGSILRNQDKGQLRMRVTVWLGHKMTINLNLRNYKLTRIESLLGTGRAELFRSAFFYWHFSSTTNGDDIISDQPTNTKSKWMAFMTTTKKNLIIVIIKSSVVNAFECWPKWPIQWII